MASAKTKNFDYDMTSGNLEMVSGAPEELFAQLFELSTNTGEWFLGPNFGYPWLVKDANNDNIGLLGTVFNSGYITSAITSKILPSDNVVSINSIELEESQGKLVGTINETLVKSNESSEQVSANLTFNFGGV